MTVSQKTLQDYTDQSRDQIVQQFKGSDKLLALIDSYTKQISLFEDMSFDLLEKRLDIDAAEGQQLDNLGKILGVEREGDSDADFRIILKSIIGIHNSEGTIESILDFVLIVTGSTAEITEESFPAFFLVDLKSPIAFDAFRLFKFLLLAKPAGVGMNLLYFVTPAFEFSGFTGGDSGPISLTEGFATIDHLSENSEPFVIVSSINDLLFQANGEADQQVTLTLGSRTAAQIVSDINTQTVDITASDVSGQVKIVSDLGKDLFISCNAEDVFNFNFFTGGKFASIIESI
jgi:hypothetical protein